MTSTPAISNRTTFLGGSDFTDLLGLEPYGCRRRAWLSKVEPIPSEETKDMRRGKFGEAAAIEEYERITGREVRRRNVRANEWQGGHIDGHIVARDERGPGVLEVKCPSSWGSAW